MLQKFLEWTAWEMEPPKAYGSFHLIFFFVCIAVCVALAYLLRNTTEKQNRVVLLVCGVFLFIAELYKQLFYTFYIGGGTYQWWIFPFQLCSITMYLCLITPWLKEGKLKQAMYDFLVSFNMFGGFVAFIEPSGLVHGYVTLTWHAFIWHMTLVFVGLYLIFSRRAAKKLSDFRNVAIMYVVLCVIAFGLNLIFRVPANGDINMFYVGPRTSPIIVFKDISAKYGWYVNTPIYMACLTLGAFIFYLPAVAATKLRKRRKDRKKQPAGIR